MPSINIQAPVDEVFKAVCDLTRHAKWAAHDISIEASQEGPQRWATPIRHRSRARRPIS